MSDVLFYVSPIVVAVSGVAYRGLKYRFLWRVYVRGGREDAVAIAAVLRMTPGAQPNPGDEKPLLGPDTRPENKLRAVDDAQLGRRGPQADDQRDEHRPTA